MALRIVSLLLFALMAGPLSLSARAVARPENRVGGSPVFLSVFASQESAKPIGTPSENGGCGYDFASGVHKYLYCQGNPINGKDPSGFAMTWNHYMGYAAEEAIQDDYKESHPGDDVEYGQQQSFGESFLKPDIFNKTTKTFLEIKPITYSEIMKGLAKMGVCEAAYGPLTLGYSPEASWQPSSHLLETDDGELFFVMNVGGLVLYKDASEIEWTAITVTSIKTAKDLLPYLYRLSAAELRPVVARMALRVGIMYGADFGATMGVVTGNAVMGGAAAP